MLLLSGVARGCPDDGEPQFLNFVVLITGVCYSPCVWDVTRHAFLDATHKHEFTAPSDIMITSRPNLVTARYDAIDHATSDTFIFEVVSKVSSVYLSRCMYTVIDDGSLARSRISDVQKLGDLWLDDGTMALPFLHAVRQRKQRKITVDALKVSDPLEQQPARPHAVKRQKSAPAAKRGAGRGKAKG